jgi:hypothetical protein
MSDYARLGAVVAKEPGRLAHRDVRVRGRRGVLAAQTSMSQPKGLRGEDLVRSPVGAFFVAELSRANRDLDVSLRPVSAFGIVAKILRQLDPWASHHSETVEYALASGRALLGRAEEISLHPGSAWWGDPIDRASQIWTGAGRFPFGARPGQPTNTLAWETYAQRPIGWRITSTGRPDLSSLDAAVAFGVGEWVAAATSRATVAAIPAGARVFEVDGPRDWHTLCREYPAVSSSDSSPAGAASISPRWDAVREEWDGVHLSFMGLLSAPYVDVTSSAGTSMLWSWVAEQTIWLIDGLIEPETEVEPFRISQDVFR